MIHFIKTYFWLILPLFFISSSEYQLDTYKTVQHNIVVKHPGEKEGVNVVLNQVVDENGLPKEYFMDVQSVICLEKVCKVIPVKIYWNNLGEYQRYELEKGATLEKYEDDLFDTEDYPKLNSILANVDSPFKEVYIDEILTVVDEHNEESDAVSGATALELDEKDTVPGAALTCYALWHWANGEIVDKVKDITGKSVNEHQLEVFLVDNNQAYFKLALIDLKRRQNYKEPFINIITKRVLIEETLLKATFNYLKKAPSKTYFSATENIFVNGKTIQKLAAIRSLKSINYQISNSYLDNLSNEIQNLNSYQEVSSFIDLIEVKKLNSKKVVENVCLLINADFIKARRAYWFLKNQELTSTQKEILNNFQKENKNRL